MRRTLFFAYGLGNYILFFVIYAGLFCFVGNLLLPRTIDVGAATNFGWALAIDLGLLAAFGLQHSVMARPKFKELWTRLVPTPIERSTYMLASSIALFALMWFWQPIPTVIWQASRPLTWWLATGLFATGWLLVPLVTLAINHFDLFGMRQVWLHLRGQAYQPLKFTISPPYNYVRHPLYIGWAIAFWAAPTMTVGHLLFAGAMTFYMVLAACIEERDLIAYFGAQYVQYRRTVPMFVPRWPSTPIANRPAAVTPKLNLDSVCEDA
jgi:protein-S-isoprenylcysteine O-methyltransferase Ste14